MELYVVASGQMDNLNRWQQDLNAQFLPIYKNGLKIPKKKRRLLVAPIQLYKICFAKEELDNVVSMVCPSDYMTQRYRWLKVFANSVKKIMGLKTCKIPTKVNAYLQPNPVDKSVAIMPIGIKDDIMFEGVEQI